MGHIFESTPCIELNLGLYIDGSQSKCTALPTQLSPFNHLFFIMVACPGHILERTKGDLN